MVARRPLFWLCWSLMGEWPQWWRGIRLEGLPRWLGRQWRVGLLKRGRGLHKRLESLCQLDQQAGLFLPLLQKFAVDL